MFKKVFILIALLLVSLSAFAVNVNTATAEQLASALKGIGPSKAAAIVEYRETKGKFKALSDLTRVKGVGAATVDKNRELIKLQ